MASFNKVILMGNLTRDPELRVTPKGTPACTKPMKRGTAEHEQNGVTMPSMEARTLPAISRLPARICLVRSGVK